MVLIYEKLIDKYFHLIRFDYDLLYSLRDFVISLEFAEKIYKLSLDDKKYLNFWQRLGASTAYDQQFIEQNIGRNWKFRYLCKNSNLSEDFFVKHRDRLIRFPDIEKALLKNRNINYQQLCKKLGILPAETLDDILENYYQSEDDDDSYSIPKNLMLKKYEDKHLNLIKYIDLDKYLEKFGKLRLIKFMYRYIDYIKDDKTIIDYDKFIDRHIFKYFTAKKLLYKVIINLPYKAYKKYKHNIPNKFLISSIKDINIKRILSQSNPLNEHDLSHYNRFKLTEKELRYLINENKLVNDYQKYIKDKGKYYINWIDLQKNTNIGRRFIEETSIDDRYKWGDIYSYIGNKYYSMKDYQEIEDLDIFLVRGIDAKFFRDNLDKYLKFQSLPDNLFKVINDDIAEIIINNDNLFFNIYKFMNFSNRSLSIEFVWKYKEIFIKSNYVHHPKNIQEIIKYFPFCKNLKNIDIFKLKNNNLIYIFDKFIPIDKLLDLLDNQNNEIGELPREIMEMILIEWNEIQNL